MANSVMQSLFGNILGSPEQSQTQAIRDAYKPYDAPGSLFQGAIRGAGAELQASVGSAFGQEPVEVAQKRKLQAIVQSAQQEADLGTPEGLSKLAEKMNQFPEFSGIALSLRQQAAQMAQEGQLKQSEIFKNISQGQKATREGRTPLADRLVELGTKEKTIGLTTAEAAEKAELERVVKIQAPKGSNIDLGAAFGKEESKEQAKAQTEAYKALGSTAVAGARTLRDIGEVESIIDDTFRGGAANLQLGASKLAAAAGIQIPKTASNSEIVQALFGKLVIPLVKQFPGALAVKELEALQKTQPQLLNEPATIKRLIALAKQDILASREVFDRASKYKKENKDSLKGFDFDAETVAVYDLISEASRLTPEKAAELAKTEEGKEKLRQLRKFAPKG